MTDLEQLKATRGERWRQEQGDYYIIDYRKNWLTHKHIDPETLARELGVLRDWETIVD